MSAKAFLAYAREDNSDNFVTNLVSNLRRETRLFANMPDFDIWWDNQVRVGDEWRRRVEQNVGDATFLIVILSPRFITSEECRREVDLFLHADNGMGRENRIIPIELFDSLTEREKRAYSPAQLEFADLIATRQVLDWKDYRHVAWEDERVKRAVNGIAHKIRDLAEQDQRPLRKEVSSRFERMKKNIISTIENAQTQNASATAQQMFRAKLVEKILVAASDEIERIADESRPYEQNLSLEENFIVRAGPVFESASAVWAVSIDELSEFWVDPNQRKRAEAYTAAQPENTVRMFVFSSYVRALEYYNVLKTHHARYGSKGAVLVCTQARWRDFLLNELGIPESDERHRQDFAILRYGSSEAGEHCVAKLTKTSLMFFSVRTLDETRQKFVSKFTALARRDMSDMRKRDQVLLWTDDMSASAERWAKSALTLFEAAGESPSHRGVFHLVFLAARPDRETLYAHLSTSVRPRLVDLRRKGSDERLLEDIWLGTRDYFNRGGFSAKDERYQFELKLQNDLVQEYPFLLVMKFKTTDLLREYYHAPEHSAIRHELYELMNPHLRKYYQALEKVTSLPDEVREPVHHAIETGAAASLLRADYEIDSIHQFFHVKPVDFSLPRATDSARP